MKKTLKLCALHFVLSAFGFFVFYKSNAWVDYSSDIVNHPLVMAGAGLCAFVCGLGGITGDLVGALINHLRKRRAAAPSEEVRQ